MEMFSQSLSESECQ